MPDIFLTEDEILQIKQVLLQKQDLQEKLRLTTEKLNELTRMFNLHSHVSYELSDYGRDVANKSSEPSYEYQVAELQGE